MAEQTNTHAAAKGENLVQNVLGNFGYAARSTEMLGTVLLLATVPTWNEHESNRPYRSWIDRPGVDHIFEAGDILGKGTVNLGAGLSAYLLGKVTHRPDLTEFGSDLTSAIILSGTIATGMKLGLNRTRPDGGAYSFPSGHATMAFTTAGIITHRYGLLPGIAAQTAATFVALSRLQENRHYISDIVAGAILGNVVAWEVSAHRRHVNATRLSIMPTDRGVALSLGLGL